MWGLRADRVFDGERLLPGGALVLIDGASIVGVEPGRAEAPSECEVHEVAGTLLPGLIDTHIHLCGDSEAGALDRLVDYDDAELPGIIESGLRRHLRAGVTTVRDLGDRRYAVVDWVESHSSSDPWPTVVAAGPPITTRRGHCWSMGGEVDGDQGLRAAVAERAERGVQVVKIMTSGGFATPGTEVLKCQFTAEQVALVAHEAHRLGLPVTAHAHGLPAVQQAIAAGVDGIEHCSCLTERGIELSAETVAALAAGGMAVCPTLGQARYLEPPPVIQAMLARMGSSVEGALQMRREVPARMFAAGVRVVSGTDGGIGDAKPHGVLHLGIAELVQGGMTSADALASATALAAEAVGLGNRKGRIRAGWDADLLVVQGDPVDDITALGEVEAVYLGGQRIDRRTDLAVQAVPITA
jgi:imidazolonepropionase-like amidohydrolase